MRDIKEEKKTEENKTEKLDYISLSLGLSEEKIKIGILNAYYFYSLKKRRENKLPVSVPRR